MSPSPQRVVVFCDVGPSIGVGHLMRCIALSEELAVRGLDVVFAADAVSVPFAAEQLARRDFGVMDAPETPAEHVQLLEQLRPDLVVVDSYLLPREVYAAIRAAGFLLLAFVDGDISGREADIFLDQNLGAELESPDLPEGSSRLAGIRFALMRDEIRAARPDRPKVEPGRGGPPRVFAFFGGTDAHGAAPILSDALIRTTLPFDAVVVAARPDLAAQITAMPTAPGQSLTVVQPTNQLVRYATTADLVLSAAGSSVWEMACLGVATGLVCVADNQVAGYQRMLASGAAVGVGLLSELGRRPDQAVQSLSALVSEWDGRNRLRAVAWSLVDGLGRCRVAETVFGETEHDHST